MVSKELEKEILKAEYTYDRIKDRVHEQQFEINELYDRIFSLKDKLYKEEDIKDKMIEFLSHSHITLGEMEKIGELYE